MQQRGFTLIELMVVIGIMALMTAVVLPGWNSLGKIISLDRVAHQFAQDVRRAQELAMSGSRQAACFATSPMGSILGYGIFIDAGSPNQYLIYANCNIEQAYEAGTDEIVETIGIEGEAQIFSTAPSPVSILFVPPDPTVYIQPGGALLGQVTFTLQSDTSRTKEVTVNTRGVIDVE